MAIFVGPEIATGKKNSHMVSLRVGSNFMDLGDYLLNFYGAV